MKNTLEYKILEYLYENKSSDFIKIIGFKEDYKLLKKTINNLEERKLIEIKPYSKIPHKDEKGNDVFFFGHKNLDLCKIKFKGTEYLFNNKKPFLTLFEILSIIGFIITFFYGLYQNEKSNSLLNQNENFVFELDSIKNEHQKLKNEYLTLKKEIHLSNVESNNN